MSLPVGLSTVTVACGPYTDATGTPYSGTVTFTPSTSVAWAATGQVILDGDVTVTLGGTGSATVALPATDDPGLTVTGFTYKVAYSLMAADRTRTGYRYPFFIQLPRAVPAVSLEALAPAVASDGVTVSVAAVTSVAGLTGTVAGPSLKTALGLGPAATLPITGTPTSGQVITATSGTAAAWQTPASSTPADATASVKGVVQLAGDLAGTATAPTVPGLAGKTPTSRTITAGTGLTGGGDLTADRTLAVAYGTTAGTAAQGNDSRITGAAQKTANLSDLADASTARTNLGLGTAATQASSAFDAAGAATAAQTAAQSSSLQKTSNLADLANTATARTNLGLGTAATQASTAFDAAGAATTAQAASLQKTSNLSDLASASTARTNLGLAAVAATGSATDLTAGSVPAGRFGNATVPVAAVNATGTPSASTFLRGDGAWAASIVAPAYPALASGNYYFTCSPASTGTSTLGGGTQLRLAPWLLTTTTSLTRLGTEVTAAGDASSVVRLGIYADDGTGLPGSLVLDAGTVSGATIGMLEVTINLTLQPGMYWVGAVAQNVTSAPTLRTGTGAPPSPNLMRLGTTAPAANFTALGVQMLAVTGAFPSTFTFGGATSSLARTHVKVA